MSLFYFHIKDGETILDDVGNELSNLAAVQKEALKACREMVTGSQSSGQASNGSSG
jgi:hypothetical protein